MLGLVDWRGCGSIGVEEVGMIIGVIGKSVGCCCCGWIDGVVISIGVGAMGKKAVEELKKGWVAVGVFSKKEEEWLSIGGNVML